jgi:hypothetical protein
MKKVFKVLSFIYLFTCSVYAQTDTSSRIRVYTPNGSSTSTYNSEESYKWAIKTDLVPMISGEFPLIGEIKLAKRLSTEFSAGVTYDLNLLGNDIFPSDLDRMPNGYYYVDAENPAASTAFRLALKFYPSKYESAIEGWFLGLQLMNKNLVRTYIDDNNPLLADEKFKRTRTGAAIIIGKQVVWDSNVFGEFFFGIGAVRINYSIPAINDVDESILRVNNSKITPNILIGYRVGFGN